VPSCRSTVTSAPLVAASSDRTAVCAPDSEHGEACEHAVPLPVGEAYSVTVVAADTCGTTVTISAAVNAATPIPAVNGLRSPGIRRPASLRTVAADGTNQNPEG
jgi:hypothetical protein